MDELRPVSEAWGDYQRRKETGIAYEGFCETFQDDRQATVQACADAYVDACWNTFGGWNTDSVNFVKIHNAEELDSATARCRDAILAVAKPQETTRERLGRAAYEGLQRGTHWDDLQTVIKDDWMDRAAAVQIKIAEMVDEIQEEADGA